MRGCCYSEVFSSTSRLRYTSFRFVSTAIPTRICHGGAERIFFEYIFVRGACVHAHERASLSFSLTSDQSPAAVAVIGSAKGRAPFPEKSAISSFVALLEICPRVCEPRQMDARTQMHRRGHTLLHHTTCSRNHCGGHICIPPRTTSELACHVGVKHTCLHRAERTYQW